MFIVGSDFNKSSLNLSGKNKKATEDIFLKAISFSSELQYVESPISMLMSWIAN